jgi:CBS domain-containing protein
MPPLLVRDVMTIGVPVCRDTEVCGDVETRLLRQSVQAEVVGVLDEDGSACGWVSRAQLVENAARRVDEVMHEEVPTVPPNIPAETAAQIMRDRGVEHLFLMHDWPGEPRPSAVVSLKTIEQRMDNE